MSPMDLATEFDGLAPGLALTSAAAEERPASHYRVDSSSETAAGAGLTSGTSI
jgi:hypothetical protein